LKRPSSILHEHLYTTFSMTILIITSTTIPAACQAPRRLLGANVSVNGQRCASNT
jgi:hypothetical protein